ncbi:MAG: DUF488 domain-containing protein, partial [Thermodesulfobacteria bacterium]|nr:DUF488 domain-containing protein [Thermodesulfobacteriota bacterium]
MRTRKQEEIVIYTLGTSQRSLEEFLEILAFYRIEQVADVRSFPSSRRYPHFCREELAQALAAAGIRYLWLGKELGGFRKEGYEAYTRT